MHAIRRYSLRWPLNKGIKYRWINRDFGKWPLTCNIGQTVVEPEDDWKENALDIEIQETLSKVTDLEEQESEVHLFLFC